MVYEYCGGYQYLDQLTSYGSLDYGFMAERFSRDTTYMFTNWSEMMKEKADELKLQLKGSSGRLGGVSKRLDDIRLTAGQLKKIGDVKPPSLKETLTGLLKKLEAHRVALFEWSQGSIEQLQLLSTQLHKDRDELVVKLEKMMGAISVIQAVNASEKKKEQTGKRTKCQRASRELVRNGWPGNAAKAASETAFQ